MIEVSGAMKNVFGILKQIRFVCTMLVFDPVRGHRALRKRSVIGLLSLDENWV